MSLQAYDERNGNANKTILITGTSSGIGSETAKLFHGEGWNVVATMRKPEDDQVLGELHNVFVTAMDVTKPDTVEVAIKSGTQRFGNVDVLLNNAGFGAYGPLEATSFETIKMQFDTNVMGIYATAKAILPHFRARGSGLIINVGSMGGKVAFPLGTLYHGTKFAVEGLSEALRFEAEAIGARVKLIEPGMVTTRFNQSLSFSNDQEMSEYQDLVGRTMKGFVAARQHASSPELVAKTIFKAATDGTTQLRYVVGDDAAALISMRNSEDDEEFDTGVRQMFGL